MELPLVGDKCPSLYEGGEEERDKKELFNVRSLSCFGGFWLLPVRGKLNEVNPYFSLLKEKTLGRNERNWQFPSFPYPQLATLETGGLP